MCENSVFLEELEVLQAIYEDELILIKSDDRSAETKITIHPSTADDKDGKYVCLTLHFSFTFSPDTMINYPYKGPDTSVANPRGISDSHLASIEENLRSLVKNMVGEQMLFSLIEYARESLTDNNHPSCDCPICLDKFEEGGVFFRTECYHYFHMKCIKSYVEFSEKNMVCPVCRLDFQIDDTVINSANEVDGKNIENDIVIDKSFFGWRKKFDRLYEKQKRNGGIIDLEVEKNKFLITLTDPREESEMTNNDLVICPTTDSKSSPKPKPRKHIDSKKWSDRSSPSPIDSSDQVVNARGKTSSSKHQHRYDSIHAQAQCSSSKPDVSNHQISEELDSKLDIKELDIKEESTNVTESKEGNDHRVESKEGNGHRKNAPYSKRNDQNQSYKKENYRRNENKRNDEYSRDSRRGYEKQHDQRTDSRQRGNRHYRDGDSCNGHRHYSDNSNRYSKDERNYKKENNYGRREFDSEKRKHNTDNRHGNRDADVKRTDDLKTRAGNDIHMNHGEDREHTNEKEKRTMDLGNKPIKEPGSKSESRDDQRHKSSNPTKRYEPRQHNGDHRNEKERSEVDGTNVTQKHNEKRPPPGFRKDFSKEKNVNSTQSSLPPGFENVLTDHVTSSLDSNRSQNVTVCDTDSRPRIPPGFHKIQENESRVQGLSISSDHFKASSESNEQKPRTKGRGRTSRNGRRHGKGKAEGSDYSLF